MTAVMERPTLTSYDPEPEAQAGGHSSFPPLLPITDLDEPSEPPTWRNTYNTEHVMFSDNLRHWALAKEGGYPYFAWLGKVYAIDDVCGKVHCYVD